MRRARVILNPLAFERRAPGKLPEVLAALREYGFQIELCHTELGQSCTGLAREAAAQDADLVVAAGGDGTVSEVAAGLLGSSTSLGVLPVGTFNNIAHGLGIPMNLDRALELLRIGTPLPMDVGWANGRPFFEAAGVGLDASLLPMGEDIKSGRYERLLDAGLTFLRQTPTEMLVIMDGQQMKVRTPLVVVANGPYYGAGFSAAPGATMRDGLLEVAVFECSIVEMARQYAFSSQNRQHQESCVSVYRAHEVAVLPSTPVPAHADGKSLGKVPLTCRVLKGALRAVVP